MKNTDATNLDIRQLCHNSQRQYQSSIKNKRNKYQAEKCKELEEVSTDSSSFWNTLKSMSDTLKPKQILPISQDKWLEHFFTCMMYQLKTTVLNSKTFGKH